MTDAVDAACDKMGRAIFEKCEAREMDELAPLMRKFADALLERPW